MSEDIYIVESSMFRPHEDWGTEAKVFRTLEEAQAAVERYGEGSIGDADGDGDWDYGFTHNIYRAKFGEGKRAKISGTTYYFKEDRDQHP